MSPEHDGKKREQEADRRRSKSPSSIPETDEIDLEAALEATQTTIENQALGRSRGGLTSKFHLMVEGRGLPMAVVLTAGQVHDSTQVSAVLDRVRVPRRGPGRPRKRPVSVLADKAFGGKPCRGKLRSRRISAVIPTKTNERTARKKRGSEGGRPYQFDKEQ